MNAAQQLLSIIIPAYNEGATIGVLLQKVLDAHLPSHVSRELIIVNDGSKDDTENKIQEFKKWHPGSRIIVVSKENGGKGTAIRAGIQHATGDIIIIQDADLEYDPEDYTSLIEPILRGNAEVVYGSRYLTKGQKDRVWSKQNKKKGLKYFSFVLGGRLVTYATNFLYFTHLTDEPTCYKVFKADILRSIPLVCTGFEFCPEVTAKVLRKKIEIVEIPIAFYPRTIEEGKKIKWKDGVEAVWVLLKNRF